MSERDRFLVLGATGRIGRHVLDGLRATGAEVLGTCAHAERGDLARLDWTRGTWPDGLLRDVRGLFLMVPEQLPDPSAAVARFVAEAAEAGVRRLVLLSALGVEVAGEETGMATIERAVRASGVPWTILRPNTLMHLFTDGLWGQQLRRSGAFAAPVGDARVSFVAPEDVAAAAVAALTRPDLAGHEPVLTGGEALSLHDAAAALTRALGRPIVYRPIDPATHADLLRQAGLPPPLVRLLGKFMAALASGAHAVVTDDVERLTGHRPRTLAAFAAATP